MSKRRPNGHVNDGTCTLGLCAVCEYARERAKHMLLKNKDRIPVDYPALAKKKKRVLKAAIRWATRVQNGTNKPRDDRALIAAVEDLTLFLEVLEVDL